MNTVVQTLDRLVGGAPFDIAAGCAPRLVAGFRAFAKDGYAADLAGPRPTLKRREAGRRSPIDAWMASLFQGNCLMADLSLKPLQWMDILEIGIEEIDRDHRALMSDCNMLTALVAKDGNQREIKHISRRLVVFCGEHFKREERLMEETGFPRHGEHHLEHHRVLAKMHAFCDAIEDDNAVEDHAKAVHSLRAVLIEILLRHDMDYKSHLQNSQGR